MSDAWVSRGLAQSVRSAIAAAAPLSQSASSHTQLPPGPRGPAVLQTVRYLANPRKFFEECASEYGDMFTVDLLGTGRWVLLANPTLVRQLFTASTDTVHAGVMNASVWGPIAGKHTLFTIDRNAHKERRHLLMPAFHGDRLRGYVKEMREVAEEVVDGWSADEVVSVQEQMQTITLRVLMRVGFGLHERGDKSALMRALIAVANGPMASPLLLMRPLQFDWGRWSPWGRVVRQIRHMDELIYREIRRRRDQQERQSDVLSFLLDARDEAGDGLSEVEIRDELVTMIMAGHDTTEISLTWAFGFVLSHPSVVQRIRQELDSVLAGQPLDVEHLPELRYLDAVVKESTRLGPVGPHLPFRRLSQPLRIGDYTLPAGVTVSNAVHLLHRRPDIYEQPLEFRPERFLNGKADPYQWAPFGGGARRCIGMAFAMWEMKIVLATVLSRLDLTLLDEHVGWERSGFFVAPRRGLPVRARRVAV